MKKKSRHHRVSMQKRPSSPIKPSPNRETLTYAQAQRMVELEVDGRVHRLSVYDRLDVIGDDDPTAQEITECNSNKENNEKPQQVLVRSARLKISKQKKNATLTAAHGPPGPHGGGGGGSGGGGVSALLEPKFRTVEYNLPAVPRRPSAYYRYTEQTAEELDEEVEYDMDEEDYAWLELVNDKRKSEGVSQVACNLFEFLMDRFEKESHLATQGDVDERSLVDEDAVCCVCMDGDGADSNVILFCDLCNIAVHQECYGVPYIPEGQWLCRHCLQCPARPAGCVFCPNRGGALKKTDDDRWGHVACALWVPEVGFSDTVFIEPIDGVGNIPPARWKLTCYLCKEKGAGACIQCSKANCYAAFHVSCAQRAGLFMKMEPVREAEATETESSGGSPATFSVKKTAYCCAHTPDGCDRRPLTVYDEPRHPKNGVCHKRGGKRGRARLKGWQKKRSKRVAPPEPGAPANSGPSITLSSFDTILNQVSVQRKRPFVERALSYWVLKRQSRNNVPLIRRLQAANPQPPIAKQPVSPGVQLHAAGVSVPPVPSACLLDSRSSDRLHTRRVYRRGPRGSAVSSVKSIERAVLESDPTAVLDTPQTATADPRVESNQALKEQLKEWHRLRHDLERARLLLELIRKREKLKREEMKLQQSVLEVQLTPFNILLRSVLDQLQEKDSYNIFALPVSLSEVPDYLDHVKIPMDFSTMRKRIDAHCYSNLEDFQADFNLIIANCMKYNAKDTFFHKAGLRMQDHGGVILRRTRREADRVGFSFPGGIHLPEPPTLEAPASFAWEHVDRLLKPANRQHMALEEQLRELLEKLDLSTAMKHGPSRSRRLKLLKKTITEVRSEMSLKKPRTTPPSEPPPQPEALEEPLPQTPAGHSTPEEDEAAVLEKLDLSTAMKHGPSRSRRLKLLKKTITEVRSEMSLKKPRSTPPSEPRPQPEALEEPLPQTPAGHSTPEAEEAAVLEKLDLSTAMKHGPSRSKRLKLLKKTITEVRSEMSLKKSRTTPPSEPRPQPEALEEPLPQTPAGHSTPEEEADTSLPPPKLEPSNTPPRVDNPPGDSEPPTLKPVKPSATSVPWEPPNGHLPASLLSLDKDLGAVATPVLTQASRKDLDIVATSVLVQASRKDLAVVVLTQASCKDLDIVATSVLAQASRKDLAQASRKDLAQASGKDLEQASGKDLAQASRKELAQASRKELAQASRKDLAQACCKDLGVVTTSVLAQASRKDLGVVASSVLAQASGKDLDIVATSVLAQASGKDLAQASRKDLAQACCKDLGVVTTSVLAQASRKDLDIVATSVLVQASRKDLDIVATSVLAQASRKDLAQASRKDLAQASRKDLAQACRKDLGVVTTSVLAQASCKDLAVVVLTQASRKDLGGMATSVLAQASRDDMAMSVLAQASLKDLDTSVLAQASRDDMATSVLAQASCKDLDTSVLVQASRDDMATSVLAQASRTGKTTLVLAQASLKDLDTSVLAQASRDDMATSVLAQASCKDLDTSVLAQASRDDMATSVLAQASRTGNTTSVLAQASRIGKTTSVMAQACLDDMATSVLAQASRTGKTMSVLAQASRDDMATFVLAQASRTGKTTSVLAQATRTGNRRTNALFHKSKSVSPQKPSRMIDASMGSPVLGTKTFLSVVIPRLETLLLPRKRNRSASGDEEEEEESPIKRLDTGIANGFVVAEEEEERPQEPRRRCASESSISSSGSLLCSTRSWTPRCRGRGVVSTAGSPCPLWTFSGSESRCSTSPTRNSSSSASSTTSAAGNGFLDPRWFPSASTRRSTESS